jgi:hypothetical protein
LNDQVAALGVFDDGVCGQPALFVGGAFTNAFDSGDSYLAKWGCSSSCGVSYCTAGLTSHGCNATMTSSGAPSVAATSGFVLSASQVEGLKQGLLFYGTSGAIAVPWGGGSSSYLCVNAPTQRTLPQSSGGTSNACDGVLAFDFLAFVAANPGALGAPFSAGDTVWTQAWFRDPPAPKTTSLSDALRFTLTP